jgi:hypothetical protein
MHELLRAVFTLGSASKQLTRRRGSVQSVIKMPLTGYHVHFQQCTSRVRVARSVNRNVTSGRSRSAKTLVGPAGLTHSLASSGLTEQHAPSSEPQGGATLPAVFQAATPSADFSYSRPAIAINRRPVTSRAPHNASCVFTERANKSAYHLQWILIVRGNPHNFYIKEEFTLWHWSVQKFFL